MCPVIRRHWQEILKYLTGNGYQTVKIQPVDNFPFCDHIETVVKLVKKIENMQSGSDGQDGFPSDCWFKMS